MEFQKLANQVGKAVNKAIGLKGSAGANIWNATDMGTIDVVENYRWTLSPPKSFDEVPYITLVEYEVDESSIVTQFSYYASAVSNAVTRDTDMLSPYENLFPRTKTGNIYKFPYFSDVNFEVNTPVWQSLDTLGDLGNAGKSLIGTLFGKGAAETAGNIGSTIGNIGMGAMAAAYPKIGIMDRPRLWQSHDFRTINIKFPLFNTYDVNDWEKNRGLCWMLTNANLYLKRDFITSIPPVYYELEIPGQHYSYASCVTNLTIYNRGNMRMLQSGNGKSSVVPDAYEVNLTLTDMVMPSKNLFQSIDNNIIQSSDTKEKNKQKIDNGSKIIEELQSGAMLA
jgi:hypothetical protein